MSLDNVKEIMSLLENHGDQDLYIKTVVSLCEKRGQPIKTVTEVVKQAVKYMEKMGREEDKVEFAQNIFKITDQKIYLEAEHAFLCEFLVDSKEKAGLSPAEALLVMEGVHVETYGSLTMK